MKNFFTKLHVYNKGFTLVELMVALSVFTMVMVISMGSILSVMDANRKSQSMRSVMDNLNYTLEAMDRTIRFGTNYHCNINVTTPPVSSPLSCGGGASSISVTPSVGANISYQLNNGRIQRTVGGVNQYLTGTDVTITNLTFWVYGAESYSGGADQNQPMVIIVISGFVGSKATTKSTFTIQTTVSQRLFDSQ